MTKNKYCDNCKKEVKANYVTGKETYNIFKEDIEIETTYLLCPNCGKKIYDEELDPNTISKVYSEYRNKHNLLNPQDIKNIRESYGISQNEFSNLLGWGEKTICRYERGAIQDNVHNDLLKFISNKSNMLTYAKEHSDRIKEKTLNKILNSIDKKEDKNLNILKDAYSYEPSIYSGFKRFDYEKTCLMILFFTNRIKNLSITKLNKLLNYSDNLFFKENCISMSGIRYVHLQFGPVPDRYNLLFDVAIDDDVIKENILYNHNYEERAISTGTKNIEAELSKEELDVLERVYDMFKDYSAKDISDYSHKEKGYKETHSGDYISYDYAEYLRM